MEVLVGLDVGTTWSKAVALDPEGTELGAGRVRTPWREVPTGAEADPAALAGAAMSAARQAIEAAGAGRVLAIGVSSFGEAGALLDRRGRAVAPAIAWYDRRGAEQAARLTVDLPAFSARTGLPATHVCTLAKHRWLRDAGGGETAVRWLNVAEWVVRALGGEDVAERSLAARTGYMDIHTGGWWPDAAAWAVAATGFFPPLVDSGTPAGHCGPGLHPTATGALLTVAGHDHLCAAVGAGATGPGDLLDSCGTAEALVRAIPPGLPAESVAAAVAAGLKVGPHVLPGRWALIGGLPGGRALAGVDLDGAAGHEHVARPGARAAELRHELERIAGPSDRMVVTGGWARHPVVATLKRSLLGPYELSPHLEAGARGAALIAAALVSDHDALPRPELQAPTRGLAVKAAVGRDHDFTIQPVDTDL